MSPRSMISLRLASNIMNKTLEIAGQKFDSRLFVGTGKFSSGETLNQVIEYSAKPDVNSLTEFINAML